MSKLFVLHDTVRIKTQLKVCGLNIKVQTSGLLTLSLFGQVLVSQFKPASGMLYLAMLAKRIGSLWWKGQHMCVYEHTVF